MMLKMQLCITGINAILKWKTVILNNNILQYYFFFFFIQINAINYLQQLMNTMNTSLKSTNLMSNNLLGGFKVQVTFIQMY